MTPLTPEQTHAYLHHIGIDDPGPPSLANLDRLIDAHLRRVAFENLDVLLDRPIEIDADKVFAKVVEGSRGGYCFELNSLFARLLLALGYELELLVARVRWGLPEDAPLTQQSHLMLRLYLAEGEFLVDVGFGTALGPDSMAQTVTEAYLRQTLESDAGDEDTGVRLALYFARKAPTLISAYDILGDSALSQVVNTVIGLPTTSSATTSEALSNRAALIARKIDFASFQDPAKVDAFVRRFAAIWDSQNNTASAPVLALFANSTSIDAETLSNLQTTRARR